MRRGEWLYYSAVTGLCSIIAAFGYAVETGAVARSNVGLGLMIILAVGCVVCAVKAYTSRE
jgi:hypothetical protein